MNTKICRHCNRNLVSRPRNLCWNCYYTPGVKDRYPPISKYGIRGHGSGLMASNGFGEPVAAQPGTIAKIVVLCDRAQKRQELFHPEDTIA